LATIFIFYGLPLGVSGITALLVRSAGFWFPLFVGLVTVQIMGTRNLLAQNTILKKRSKKNAPIPQSEFSSENSNAID